MTVSLDQYFEKFSQGDQGGFARLFDEWNPPVCYFAGSILGNEAEAEDVVAEAFVKLWERRKIFRDVAGCKVFLYKMVRNKCLSILKHRKVVLASERDIRSCLPDDRTIFDQMVESEFASQMSLALGKLPPRCRQIMEMVYWEGKTSADIATVLNLSVNTVKAQRQKGLSILRRSFLRILWIFSPAS